MSYDVLRRVLFQSIVSRCYELLQIRHKKFNQFGLFLIFSFFRSIEPIRNASVGSELDHKVKEAAAQGEDAWDGIGNKTGLFVWRVENFTIQPWPEERYGTLRK